MRRGLPVIFLFVLNISVSHAELPDNFYYIGSDVDFFAYNRSSGTIVFQETGSFKQLDGRRRYTAANYFIDLTARKVLLSVRGKERLKGCFAGRFARSPSGDVVVSQNDNTKTLSVLELKTRECQQKIHELSMQGFNWSDDGKQIEIEDYSNYAYYLMNPEDMGFHKLEPKGAVYGFAWSQKLNASLFVYRPSGFDINDDNSNSNQLDYYYLDHDKTQKKLDDEFPLTNPQGDVYFYVNYPEEELPVTTFVDKKTGEVLARKSNFYLGPNHRYAVWLKDGWVYFQGASGVLNYRTDKFVSFSTELTPEVFPFSVSEGRYAIMYLRGEDRLMIYDLEERKYIESYEPFWRN